MELSVEGPYRALVRPLLFRIDPEIAHRLAIRTAELASAAPALCSAVAARCAATSDRLTCRIGGITFASPLGLAAGFDKSARGVPLLGALGFGHVEVGSVSAEASPGNPKPRLFRIPEDRGIVVNYGLPNDGALLVARRIARIRRNAPLGVNIVSTNRGHGAPSESDEAVIADYLMTLRWVQPLADYVCLNLSCPNTREGRGFFNDMARLRVLLDGLARAGVSKPLFLKVAPFNSIADLESFLETVDGAPFVTGFSVNLPPGKPDALATPAERVAALPGAVSGPAAATAADRTIRELYRRMDRARFHIVGSGGVFTAEDAYRKIKLGASLVQLMTALVYEGPGVVRHINEGLARLLEADGVTRVQDAVGVNAHLP